MCLPAVSREIPCVGNQAESEIDHMVKLVASLLPLFPSKNVHSYFRTISAISACLLFLFPSRSFAQVTITANVPKYPFQVLAGSTRQINVNIKGGTLNTVNWSVLSATGGASATFTTPNGAGVSAVAGALPTVQVNIGSVSGNCSISGSGAYTVSSTASVTVQAQSVDDPTKTVGFLFNVCANSPPVLGNGTSSVIVVPAYQQAYKSQPMTLQSFVVGCADESGTWSIASEPSGGDGTLADTSNRDTVFAASVTGRYTLQYQAGCNSGTSTATVYVSPNALPSYSSTPNGTRPHECYVDPELTGHDYEVGAGKQYTTISSTPALTGWTPGTIMRIWNTDTTGSSPSIYHEYYEVRNSGTATQPMIVCGVADAQGNLPILDGTNATAQSDVDTSPGGGIITLWPPDHFGYWQSGSAGPRYVSITGLDLRNANSTIQHYEPGSSSATNWDNFTSCVNFHSGAYIDLSGNEMDNCSLGLFSEDNSSNAWSTISQNLTFMGNHIQQAGDPGSAGYTHQVYAQTFYSLFEGNKIDNPSSSVGSMVKWRGVEGIFRYNYFGDGGQRIFDLVENQDGPDYMTFEQYLSGGLFEQGDQAGANGIAAYQESAQKDFIYGNEMLGTSASSQIHYAGDQGVDGMWSRNGILYVYSNTLDNAQEIIDNGFGGDGSDTYLQPRVVARNNIFWARTKSWTGDIQMVFGQYASIIFDATTNLMQAGTFTITPPILGAVWNEGTAEGWPSDCDGSCQWPLTVPLNTHLYGLTAANYLTTTAQPYDATTFVPPNASAAIDAGTASTDKPLATMPVRWQFSVATGALTPRLDPLTIGAVDQASGSVGTAATPTFSPGSGTYSSAQTVTISSTTPGATIYYTTDGSTPTTGSAVYSAPITVSTSETIAAIAVATGYSNSAQGSATYVINLGQVATPTFTPPAGTYSSQQTVTISDATAGATIYYTTNGTTPTTSSTVYSGPITVTTTETVEAIAVLTNYTNSAVAIAVYTLNLPQASTPTFSPVAGSYTSTQTITISSLTPGSAIYYTVNGSTPTTSSTLYTGPITVASTETVKAIATATGFNPSAVASATYTISLAAAATPTFSPGAGTYSSTQTVTISSTTAGATIYYTTNGRTPTTRSTLYTGPITVSATETVKAIAIASGFSNSAVGSALYTINLTQTATPIFAPPAGSYTTTQIVAISSATPSAKIYYTTNGTAPTTSSTLYSGPITVSSSETIKALATSTGFSDSSVATAVYTITPQVVLPIFTPGAGTYSSAQSVSISTSTPGATIHYTTNGTTPTTASPVYVGPITVSTSETLLALAVATGFSNSAIASATYTINLSQAALPVFSPAAGTYTSAQTVTLSTTTPSATIHYTTNGTAPTTSSVVYGGPITVSSTETVKALAVASGFSNSAIASATYTINLPQAALPAFSPAAGTYTSAQTVILSTTTPSATIYYTTNGTAPTTSSAVYSGPITVSSTETVNAMATAVGYTNSAVASAAYTINLALPTAATPTFSPAGGAYTSAQSVTISTTTPGATIYYTTNGSTPTTGSAVYSSPIAVPASETLNAIAVAVGYQNSAVGTATYTINVTLPVAATPTFSPAGGTYTSAQTVTISSTTPSAIIYYTTNGTTPTTGSAVYSSPISVPSTETLEAIATASGYTTSAAGTATYTINLPAPDFSVVTSPTAMSVTGGLSGTAAMTVTPSNGFNSAVGFSCTGLPAGASCSFAPATVTPSGAPASTTLTVTTTTTSAALHRNSTPLFPGSVLAVALCFIGWKRRRGLQLLLLLVVSVTGLCLLNGCGGATFASNTTRPPVTATITVTATSGSLQHTTNFLLTVK